MFSLFEGGIKNVNKSKVIDINQFLEILKQPNPIIDKIRVCNNKEERQELKKKLTYVTFGGVFDHRSASTLKEPSELASLDFDDLTDIESVRNELIKDKYTHCVFISPSGNGLKLVVKIPKVSNNEEYRKYWSSIAKHYNIVKVDEASKDISRACYMSFDSKPYLNKDSEVYTDKLDENLDSNLSTVTIPKDESRSGREFSEVCKLIRQEFTKEQIFQKMMAFSKWANPHHPSYRDHTYNKALSFMKREKEMNNALGEDLENIESIELNDFNYYKKLKKDKRYIIENFVKPCTLNMWASPPKNLKSIEALHAASCIATGKKFYGLNVKRNTVLMIDLENPEQEIKKRLENTKSGLGIRKLSNLYYMPRAEHVDVYSPKFIARVEKTIEKYKIKVIFLDTLRRMSPDLKENEADDVSKFYRLFFAKLRDKYGVTIIFLHHMDKKAKGYRGSTDLQAMVDTSYNIIKKSTSGNEVYMNICKDVSRSDAVDFILGTVRFNEEAIEFETRAVLSSETQTDNYKELVKLIAQYIENHGDKTEVSRASINIFLHEKGIDEKKKRGSITRVLEYLRDSDKIDMTKKGKYIWRTQ